MKKYSSLLVCCLIFINIAIANSKELSLVKDGKANAVIVLRKEPNGIQLESAKVLADHIRQISGAEIKIIGIEELENPEVRNNTIIPDNGIVDVKNFIFIGDGDLVRFNLKVNTAAVGYGGFIVKTFPNAIVLAGRDNLDPGELFTADNRYTPYSRGTLYATTWLLEKYLGIRYLWPGESGKVVPKNKNISIPEINYKFTPVLKQRQMRICPLSSRGQRGLNWLHISKHNYLQLKKNAKKTISDSVNWRAWHRLGGTLGIVSGDGFILPEWAWKKWPQEHPEWFAMQLDGSRSQMVKGELTERPRLCVSNTNLIAAIAKLKIEELKQHPEQRCVSIELQDGGYTGFCMCDKCKALDVPSARKVDIWSWDHKNNKMIYFKYPALTDRMVWFWNKIAEKVTTVYPDTLLLVKQYSAYSAAPLQRKLHPNIIVRFVGESFNLESERKLKMQDWNAWSKMASKIFYRPNLLYQGYHQGFPLVNYTHKFSEDFQYMAHNSMLGTDFDAILECWSTMGLNYYVIAELNWNPDMNVDEIIDDYCRSGFGKGGKWVRKYWSRVKNITNQGATNEQQHMLAPFTTNVITELAGYLDNAQRTEFNNKKISQRIDFLRSGLAFTDMQAKAYRLNNQIKQNPHDKTLQVRGQKMLDKKWEFMRNLYKKYPLSIDVALARFYSERCFSYLGNRKPSPEILKKYTAEEQTIIKPTGKIIEADEKGRLVVP